MALIEVVPLKSLTWAPGRRARMWYAQPRFHVDAHDRPFVYRPIPGEPTGLDLLRAIITYDSTLAPPQEAPVLILLPEFSLNFGDIPAARDLVLSARANTLFIFGIGQLTAEQARGLEPDVDLWGEPPEDRFTNCAVVATGRTDRFYLQPKILPSRWELDYHWPGNTIRYFSGDYVQFVTVICSELLGRPEGQSTIADVANELRRRGLSLNLVVWLQHNQNPRSPEFNQSLRHLAYHPPTVLVVSSRNDRTARLSNFAVSGAIVPHSALPSDFRNLDKRFRYVEPLQTDLPMSRIVLLRYDAHAYRVETVLADSINHHAGVERGELFYQSAPYLFRAATLEFSQENIHLNDICQRARTRAVEARPALEPQIDALKQRLVALGTEQFLGCLDVAALPIPPSEDLRHAAGQRHAAGDFRCKCWAHRECIDKVCDEDATARPLTELLVAAAVLMHQGVPAIPAYALDRRTNFRTELDGHELAFGIVYPFNYDAEETHRGLSGGEVTLVNSPYIILGTGESRTRPRVHAVDAARPAPLGAIRAGSTTIPSLNAIYWHEFWSAEDNGTLRALFCERFLRH